MTDLASVATPEAARTLYAELAAKCQAGTATFSERCLLGLLQASLRGRP
ncbi:hypothetical protein K7W42_20445 [Deinococcus sp. HMF7604]|nr:hypothetical protein [Deinococcus betulae]MBZ9753210.1 hypothetical protein [Deinococcus betulae]